jgi:hypothetical protein
LIEFETIEEFHETLEAEDDLGVVIRAHLHLERYLNSLIEKIIPDKRYLKRLKLDFEKSVWLTVCLGLEPGFAKSLLALNSLRNQFAHSLEASLNRGVVNNFYKNLSSDEKNLVQEAFVKTEKKSSFYKGKKFNQIPSKARFILCMIALRVLLVKTINEAHERKLKKEST